MRILQLQQLITIIMLTFYKVAGTHSIADNFTKCVALHAAGIETYVRFTSLY